MLSSIFKNTHTHTQLQLRAVDCDLFHLSSQWHGTAWHSLLFHQSNYPAISHKVKMVYYIAHSTHTHTHTQFRTKRNKWWLLQRHIYPMPLLPFSPRASDIRNELEHYLNDLCISVIRTCVSYVPLYRAYDLRCATRQSAHTHTLIEGDEAMGCVLHFSRVQILFGRAS